MSVPQKDIYSTTRYILREGGIVVPFDANELHQELSLSTGTLQKILKPLISNGIVEKEGNWRHGWYFLTTKGESILREKVGLPEEARNTETIEITN